MRCTQDPACINEVAGITSHSPVRAADHGAVRVAPHSQHRIVARVALRPGLTQAPRPLPVGGVRLKEPGEVTGGALEVKQRHVALQMQAAEGKSEGQAEGKDGGLAQQESCDGDARGRVTVSEQQTTHLRPLCQCVAVGAVVSQRRRAVVNGRTVLAQPVPGARAVVMQRRQVTGRGRLQVGGVW